jgi:hypothetical protein
VSRGHDRELAGGEGHGLAVVVGEDLDGDAALQDHEQLVGVAMPFPLGHHVEVGSTHDAKRHTVELPELLEAERLDSARSRDGIVDLHAATVGKRRGLCLGQMSRFRSDGGVTGG